ncbi:DUF3046 domain-containing protein [Propionimicrobium lymphophilum]|uniref:DUF3046 domain-containing protein n=1 Tax=Propionimicrobium lymphophilum ACS-093-V-SCH5 TaxID=883161 RepID=S2W0N5_9ACTN|nr:MULTISPECIES: DUF3046 domain-containing protein [Propionimicrobium]EPD33318.1 hypothetical protein HMPREF9306_00857 [Propionimicrobium lymphophilum ACS-093-V-SCH5]ETJ98148.1 PF11248 family protein [Propionimicrobium sp. BV2F7]MDK7709700.1 DUF3046 domain-containing protein [Propionimicrobium lymphophilum]MDK7734038.1 DUF3046 domain-containing protein [Propionimicrobium lymphophilum]
MREQELWAKLKKALGDPYYLVWTEQACVPGLDSKTVRQALDSGLNCKKIWRAVWSFLELDEKEK